MALYDLDVSSNVNLTASLKAALTAAGIIDTLHYETTTVLIITTTLFNKILRLVSVDFKTEVYVGDSWSAGDAVTNQVAILPSLGNSDSAAAAMIVTDKVLCIGQRQLDSKVSNAIFCRLDSDTQEYAALSVVYNTSYAFCRNLTDNVGLEVRQMNGIIISDDGYYYASPLVCSTPGGVVLSQGIQGLKSLQKAPVNTYQYQRYGDNVVIPGGSANGVTSYLPMSLLIVNGYSWAPA